MTVDARAFLSDLHGLCFRDIPAEARKAMQECVKEAERSAKATPLFKDVTGVLRKNISGVVTNYATGDATGELRADTSYARYVENGTRPHLIAGNPNLQFVWKGVRVNFRYVNHPGTEARPFMERAGEWGGLVLHDALSAFTDDAITRFNT